MLPQRAISGLDHSSSQGWVLEAPGRRVPLPLPSNQVFGGGDPKAILERAPEEGPAWAPTRLAAPFLYPRLPREAQSHLGQAPEPVAACFPLPNPFLWPSLCDFGPWLSFQIEGFQEALQGSNGAPSLWAAAGLVPHSSLSGRPQSWAEGPGAGPRVQPSSYSFPSLNSINMSTPLLWE